MMISPETYAKSVLKGKSRDDLKKEIESLKAEIEKQKACLLPPFEEAALIMPSPLTRISLCRDYLEKAKEAYLAEGGILTESPMEKADRLLNESLPRLSTLTLLTDEGKGSRQWRCQAEGDWFTLERTEDPRCLKTDRECLIRRLQALHLGEWDALCLSDQKALFDWRLTLTFDDRKKPLSFQGKGAGPVNFFELTDLLEELWEEAAWEEEDLNEAAPGKEEPSDS